MTSFRFFLVRHGKAEAKAATDAARHLTPEGRAAFEAQARANAARLTVSRVVTSPFVRARETAILLALETGAPLEEDAALAAGASSGHEILALGARLGAGVALVGHNPELAEAVAIAAGRSEDVRPGAIAAIEASGGGFRLAWLAQP